MVFEEWKDEPNHLEWVSDGFHCLIQRHGEIGHLCGYVGIPEGHPWFEKDYMEIDADVHGSLTFARYGTSDEHKDKNWYKPQTDENGKKLWWIGFDCNHYGDLAPYGYGSYRFFDGVYRNMFYVHQEVESLAKQAFATLQKAGESA